MTSLLESRRDPDEPSEPVHFFCVSDLDRCSEKRKDKQWLQEVTVNNPETRFLLFLNSFPVLNGKELGLKEFTYEDLQSYITQWQPPIVFLGCDLSTSRHLFAVDFESGDLSLCYRTPGCDGSEDIDSISLSFVCRKEG